jgi:uncharacterized cupin superfamily protein
MTIVSFGKFKTPNTAPITSDLGGWNPVEGSPTMKTWIEHAPADGKFLTGYWEATPGTYQVTYNADELVHMFEGKATLTEANGSSNTYMGGDSFFVAAGSKITWKTIETVRKIFAIRIGQDVAAPFGD